MIDENELEYSQEEMFSERFLCAGVPAKMLGLKLKVNSVCKDSN